MDTPDKLDVPFLSTCSSEQDDIPEPWVGEPSSHDVTMDLLEESMALPGTDDDAKTTEIPSFESCDSFSDCTGQRTAMTDKNVKVNEAFSDLNSISTDSDGNSHKTNSSQLEAAIDIPEQDNPKSSQSQVSLESEQNKFSSIDKLVANTNRDPKEFLSSTSICTSEERKSKDEMEYKQGEEKKGLTDKISASDFSVASIEEVNRERLGSESCENTEKVSVALYKVDTVTEKNEVSQVHHCDTEVADSDKNCLSLSEGSDSEDTPLSMLSISCKKNTQQKTTARKQLGQISKSRRKSSSKQLVANKKRDNSLDNAFKVPGPSNIISKSRKGQESKKDPNELCTRMVKDRPKKISQKRKSPKKKKVPTATLR